MQQSGIGGVEGRIGLQLLDRNGNYVPLWNENATDSNSDGDFINMMRKLLTRLSKILAK